MQSLLSLTSCFSVSCVSSTTMKNNCPSFWTVPLWSSVDLLRAASFLLLFPVALLLLTEIGKEAASVPAKLLHSRISCQSCLIYDWDLQCWTQAHESLGGYSVDSPNSQGIVKFYCLVHLGQFPRFPVKLGLVRRSTSRFVLCFLCNVGLAWRSSLSFSWTNVFWKSGNL